MAVTQGFKYAGYPWNLGSPPMLTVPEKASLSSIAGAVVINNGGYLDDAGADPTAICGVLAENGHNGSSDGDYSANIIATLPFVVFEAQMYHATAASSALAQSMMFTAYEITTSGNYHCIDVANTTNKRVIVVGFKDPIGTEFGRVYCIFNPTVGCNVYAAAIS